MSVEQYHASASNTNRLVTFRVEAGVIADANATLFHVIEGYDNKHPYIGRQTTALTSAQRLGQLRFNLISAACRRLAPVVGVRLVDDAYATGGVTANSGPAIEFTFETDSLGTFQNPLWAANPATNAKDVVADITDSLGKGGSNIIKTRPGLQSSIDGIKDVSYDGGVTGPFGVLSTSGNIVLPNGATTAAAPTLVSAGTTLSGIKISFVR